MPFSLGVDIGSTYTAAAVWRDGSVQSVPLGNRANAVPSVLFLREDGTLLVGEAATRRAVVEPDRQARDFKRRMGDEVPILLGGDQRMTAHELTGHLLRWVVDTVAEREGERPGHLVLTHPAEWGDYRRELLVESAATAGLPDVVLLPGAARHVTLSRAQLETLIRPQILSTVQLFAQIVNRAGAEPRELHGVLLVGGSSRIPLVSQLLRTELGARIAVDAHPKYAVSLGAAITAAPHVAPAPRPPVPDWNAPTAPLPSFDTPHTMELRP